VKGLSEADRRRIALYLNLDMVASPNAGYFVLDGDGSDGFGADAPAGSIGLERVLVESLNAADVSTRGTGFTGDSDYQPFYDAGIATGGLFTGASETMTKDDAPLWGGKPDAPFDRCYHQACDRIDTIDRVALDRNADAAAATIGRLALSTADLEG
jgi:Zn-dependent M28 family amino/carboxypeptidase